MKKYILTIIITAAVLLAASPAAQAEGTIGSEALVPASNLASALYSSTINFRPGDGETVTINPPRFSWPYAPDRPNPFFSYCANGIPCPKWAPYQFAFQVSDDEQFNHLLVDVKRTPSNSYNFVGPFTSSATRVYYWRVGYIAPRNLKDASTWTLQSDSWEETPSVWSATLKFIVADNAAIWDRSMLADPNYMTQKGAHPHMLFNAQNRANLYQWLKDKEQKYNAKTGEKWERDAGNSWVNVKKDAITTITSSWWRNEQKPTPVLKTTLEKEFSNGGEIFDWLMENGYFKETEGTQGSPKPLTDAAKAALQSAFPVDSAKILTILQQALEWIGNWGGHIAKAIFVWQMCQNAPAGDPDRILADQIIVSKPQNALALLAQYYIDQKGAIIDTISDGQYAGHARALAFGYDWLFDVLDTAQKPTVLRALELLCLNMTRGSVCQVSVFYAWSKNPYGPGDPTGEYPGSFTVRSSSLFLSGHSHTIDNFYSAMVPALAAYADSPVCKELFDLGMNYMIGVTQPFSYESGLNEGRSYGSGKLFWGTGDALYRHILAATIFPEAKLEQNPFWQTAAQAWDKFVPVGLVQGHDQWEDTGWGDLSFSWESNSFGRDLSYFTGSGTAYTHWQNQLALDVYGNSRGQDSYESIPISFYFHPPAPVLNTQKSQLFLSDGYVMGSSRPSNDAGCFRDGVGFIFQARPRGRGTGGHSPYSDLSFDLWAYGTMITDAGTRGIDQVYGYHPLQRYCLFVNGLGPVMSANQPYYSRIIAYKDTPDYTYAAADATNAYPTKAPGYYWSNSSSAYNYTASPYNQSKLPFLKKVRRHLLFVHNKYFVIFDDFLSEQPGGSKFSWLYHVLENTLNLNDSDASFTYTSNIKKYLDPALLKNRVDKTPPADVTIYVKHIGDPQSLTPFADGHLSGDKVASNPITGEDFYTGQIKYDDHLRAHAIWVSNKTPANNWHFMTVIYPKNPNDPDDAAHTPEITRIDDYTAKVRYGSDEDIIRFNPGQEATLNSDIQPTLEVDLVNLTPLPVPDGSYGLPAGDVSGDGGLSAYDAALALRQDLSSDQKTRAEVSNTVPLNALDAALIAERAIGL